jgi:predicted metal-dependent phosphoesterase TrpH
MYQTLGDMSPGNKAIAAKQEKSSLAQETMQNRHDVKKCRISCYYKVVMKFKIDLHVHSRHSGDNDSDPEESLLRAIELNLDGIAFTEHYSYEASEPAEKLKEKYGHRILILRGVEFSSAEGHCLIFGVDTDKLLIKHFPAALIAQKVAEKGGVVIPSHPYRRGTGMGNVIRSLKGITALEGYNGCNMHTLNVEAIEAAAALGIPFTGGSDAHAPGEVGSCYTVFYDRVTQDNFVSLLRAGRYTGADIRKISRMIIA